jgi:hypothetical protein
MRRAAVLALATVVFALPAVAGAEAPSEPAANPSPPAGQSQTTIQPSDQAPAPDQPAAKSAPAIRLLTPEQEGRRGIVHGVVDQSFRDFGLMESKIPPVLLEAMADPYARVTPATCEHLASEIRRLETALGPDLDAPINTQRLSNMKRGEGQARDASLDALRSTVQNYIPFDGYIRIVSGADRHDHRVLAAIQAGSVRRAYLKGLGEAKGCNPPATPSHVKAGSVIPDQGLNPRYPIKLPD